MVYINYCSIDSLQIKKHVHTSLCSWSPQCWSWWWMWTLCDSFLACNLFFLHVETRDSMDGRVMRGVKCTFGWIVRSRHNVSSWCNWDIGYCWEIQKCSRYTILERTRTAWTILVDFLRRQSQALWGLWPTYLSFFLFLSLNFFLFLSLFFLSELLRSLLFLPSLCFHLKRNVWINSEESWGYLVLWATSERGHMRKAK